MDGEEEVVNRGTNAGATTTHDSEGKQRCMTEHATVANLGTHTIRRGHGCALEKAADGRWSDHNGDAEKGMGGGGGVVG
ncbi:hypothetical protein SESBI_30794 [Sesbania bispinosa]|nr:hypothetical protein SESBI_30794 [Sesbania bispinosa]